MREWCYAKNEWFEKAEEDFFRDAPAQYFTSRYMRQNTVMDLLRYCNSTPLVLERMWHFKRGASWNIRRISNQQHLHLNSVTSLPSRRSVVIDPTLSVLQPSSSKKTVRRTGYGVGFTGKSLYLSWRESYRCLRFTCSIIICSISRLDLEDVFWRTFSG